MKNWKSAWKRTGYCNAHEGQGKNLNMIHDSGSVAKHYKLPTNAWVCEDCWNKYKNLSSTQKVIEKDV